MEDHRLKAFCLVVEHRSFSRAAQAKNMTQSAMSHLIKNLEDELGTKLLNRTVKGVMPTPAGRLLYAQAKQILGLYASLDNDLQHLARSAAGPLHIGACSTAIHYLLPQVLYGFSRTHPKVAISSVPMGNEAVASALLEGSISLGFVDAPTAHHDIAAEEVAREEIVVVASDSHPLAGKTRVAPKELLAYPFVMPGAASGIRQAVDSIVAEIEKEGRKITVAMELGDPSLVVQMVQAGLGIALASKWSAYRGAKEGSLAVIPLAGKQRHQRVFLASLKDVTLPATARMFRDFLRTFTFFDPF